MIKLKLNDGTNAILCSIVQTYNFQSVSPYFSKAVAARVWGKPHLGPTENAFDELSRVAEMFLLPGHRRPASIIIINIDPDKAASLISEEKLPPIMCIGEFVSHRQGRNRPNKPVNLHVVWFQHEMVPYMSAENETAFGQINWDLY